MRAIHLQVSRAEVDEGVALTTAYHGVKNADAQSVYDRVALVEADGQWLAETFSDCAAQADGMLREYLHGGHQDDGRQPLACYQACLLMPDNWDDRQHESLQRQLRAFFVATVTARWMALVMPEQENRYAAMANLAAEGCLKALHARRRPLPPRTF